MGPDRESLQRYDCGFFDVGPGPTLVGRRIEMPVDEALLERHTRFSDPELGISERSLRLDVGGGWTVGVLSRPLGPERSVGWVITHSFGPEQMELQMTEVFLARRLAAAGFPVLRFHCQGYGDSERMDVPPDFSTHLRDTVDAVAAMRAEVPVAHVGLIGARFGGTVAAVAADRLGLSDLVLVAPAVSGRRFATEMFRATRITAVAGDGSVLRVPRAGDGGPIPEDRALTVNGFLVTPEAQEEMRALDLLSLVRAFRGRALVIQISMKDQVQPAASGLVEHLNGLGAEATLRVVTDPFAPRFGREHLRAEDGENIDVLGDLNRSVVQVVLGWATDLPVSGTRAGGAG